jgi:hypothetical protein
LPAACWDLWQGIQDFQKDQQACHQDTICWACCVFLSCKRLCQHGGAHRATRYVKGCFLFVRGSQHDTNNAPIRPCHPIVQVLSCCMPWSKQILPCAETSDIHGFLLCPSRFCDAVSYLSLQLGSH